MLSCTSRQETYTADTPVDEEDLLGGCVGGGVVDGGRIEATSAEAALVYH